MFCQQHVYSNLSTAAPDAPVEAILALSSINDYSQAYVSPSVPWTHCALVTFATFKWKKGI